MSNKSSSSVQADYDTVLYSYFSSRIFLCNFSPSTFLSLATVRVAKCKVKRAASVLSLFEKERRKKTKVQRNAKAK